MKNIQEMVRKIISVYILPRIERDGITQLLLPEQIVEADFVPQGSFVSGHRQRNVLGSKPAKGRRPCDLRHYQHREIELAVGLTGQAPYCIGNKLFVFTPGRMVLLPGWTPHTTTNVILWRSRDLDPDQPSSTIWLKVYPAGVWTQVLRFMDEKKGAMQIEATQPYMFLGPHFNRLITCLLEEVRSKPLNYDRVGRCLLTEFMERCLRTAIIASAVDPLYLPSVQKPAKSKFAQSSGMVRAAREFIHSNYQLPISLDDIADAAGTSADRLGREFKVAIDLSPIQYLLNVRMEAARELLMTDMKVSEVAGMVGIEDPCYFSRLFRRSNAISPLQYRKRMAKAVKRPPPPITRKTK